MRVRTLIPNTDATQNGISSSKSLLFCDADDEDDDAEECAGAADACSY